jgi:transmembrane sensor
MSLENPSSPNSGRDALDWARDSGHAGDFLARVELRLRQRRQRRRILAGGVAAGLLAIGVWYLAPTHVAPPAAAEIVRSGTTLTPERRVLEDGSIIELKEGAALTLDYSPATRHVTLQRGTAHFTVVPNKARPFVVEAGGVETQAVGTAFSVELGGAQVDVVVTEGRVAVQQRDTAANPNRVSAPTLVNAGSRVGVPRQPSAAVPTPQSLSPAELDEHLNWRVPRLDLNGTSLAQAVALINQHSPVHLVLGEPELGRIEVSGTLRADNIDPLLRMLESNYEVKAERQGSNLVLRRAR